MRYGGETTGKFACTIMHCNAMSRITAFNFDVANDEKPQR